jgi:hypothetical protein
MMKIFDDHNNQVMYQLVTYYQMFELLGQIPDYQQLVE